MNAKSRLLEKLETLDEKTDQILVILQERDCKVVKVSQPGECKQQ